MSHGGVGAGYLSNANGSFISDFARMVVIMQRLFVYDAISFGVGVICIIRVFYYEFCFYVFVHKIFHMTSYEVIEFFAGIDALLTLEWFMCSFAAQI